ncbi:MAG: tRNA (adenosine(37)-N6)-threonylcarbamoyltransferase complex ATPase subunit type 1 TsaE [Candidatus Delongbacteria bacterium]|nr:tRNA (adenosine(37)-N6)-threonylcarbamoyltransferase complex ATPase subunit type 1 TsaE [Candidatus Delongbacteria bacterium]
MAVEQLLTDEEQTISAGRCLGRLLSPGSLLLLEGELGAGKTTLIRGIAAALGVSQRVQSPTFDILHEYDGRLPLFHFDLYRLVAPDQLFEIGFFDYIAREGVTVVEWPDRLGELADAATHRLLLEYHPRGRLLTTSDFPADSMLKL